MTLCHVLLGVMGSVAALKGPELAVRIAVDMGAQVKVLLTRGAEKFWSTAEGYNSRSWSELKGLQEESIEGSGEKRISIVCKYLRVICRRLHTFRVIWAHIFYLLFYQMPKTSGLRGTLLVIQSFTLI